MEVERRHAGAVVASVVARNRRATMGDDTYTKRAHKKFRKGEMLLLVLIRRCRPGCSACLLSLSENNQSQRRAGRRQEDADAGMDGENDTETRFLTPLARWRWPDSVATQAWSSLAPSLPTPVPSGGMLTAAW